MGYFDTFEDEYKCRRCGYTTKIGWQTKILDGASSYEVGDIASKYIVVANIPSYNSLTHKCKIGWINEWLDCIVMIRDNKFYGTKDFKSSEIIHLEIVKPEEKIEEKTELNEKRIELKEKNKKYSESSKYYYYFGD